jgi:hypothetical protein
MKNMVLLLKGKRNANGLPFGGRRTSDNIGELIEI